MLFDDRCLLLIVAISTLVAAVAAFYWGAIVSGVYKDPMMARFRQYGEERRPYPICRFLESVGVLSGAIAILMSSLTTPGSYISGVFPPLIFTIMSIFAFVGDYLLHRKPEYAQLLPLWYWELLRDSTRQERRFMGYAWLKIPRAMRWRMNGDQTAFRVWADMVRISVIYGARDPDDPWRIWT